MRKEIWEAIPGYEGIYQASNNGNVKTFYNKNGKKQLSPKLNRSGYLQVVLVKNKHKWHVGIHILVLMAFSKSMQNGKYVNHIDGNKTNNYIENLEWVTASENNIHARDVLKKGLKPVIQLTMNDIPVAEFESQKIAGEVTGINKVGISMCCRAIIGSAGGYKWKFKNPIHSIRYQNRIFKYKYRVTFRS